MKEELSVQEAARFTLVRKAVHDDDALTRAFVSALKLSAETLGVARVGIWMFEAQDTRIRCATLYERDSGRTPSGEIIDLSVCPKYAEALRERRVVAADDVRSDPRTTELGPYLERHGIASLLDSPVFQQGDAVAVVCHEHVGTPRVWTQQDKHFASTVSDMLGLYLEQRAAQAYYRDLIDTRHELQQHRVMESLGRMATAVAHDFNNLLLAIGLKADLMRMEGQSAANRDKSLDELNSIVSQGGRLVRQLLDCARDESPAAEAIDLVEVMRDLEPTLRTLERDGIKLDLKLGNEPVPVRVERSRAEQVIMNLAHNARDALLGGGLLSVELTTQWSDLAQAKRAVLRVADSGVGMDDSTREHMFEPFFTTKAKGKGDGLGLATVYNVVNASRGSIEVKSELGAGTEFTIRWPVAQDAASRR